MDRNWLDDNVEAYVDEELSADDRKRFEAQLEVNAELRSSVLAAAHIREALAGLEPKACPDTAVSEVLERVRHERKISSPSGRYLRALMAPGASYRSVRAAAVAVVVVAAFVMAALLMSRGVRQPTEVEQGLADVKLALAYVGLAGRQAGDVVRHEAVGEGVIIPLRRAVVRVTGEPLATEPDPRGRTPSSENHKQDSTDE